MRLQNIKVHTILQFFFLDEIVHFEPSKIKLANKSSNIQTGEIVANKLARIFLEILSFFLEMSS